MLIGACNSDAMTNSRIQAFHGIDFDDLERIFSPGGVKFVGVGSESLLQLLTEIGLETSERAKVLAALAGPKEMKVPKEPTTLIALQGSASYLMIGLGIENLLLTKDELLERVDAQLIKFTNECANKVNGKETGDHINKKKGTVLAANCLYARALLSSSTINAEYIYCQREFNDKTNLQYEVYSQVWAGFLAAKSQAAWPSGGAIAVDIGTGEMKFGCEDSHIFPLFFFLLFFFVSLFPPPRTGVSCSRALAVNATAVGDPPDCSSVARWLTRLLLHPCSHPPTRSLTCPARPWTCSFALIQPLTRLRIPVVAVARSIDRRRARDRAQPAQDVVPDWPDQHEARRCRVLLGPR